MRRLLLPGLLSLYALSMVAMTAAGADTNAGNDTSPARNSIKLAVGYCTERCHKQFDYCQYRDEPYDRCMRRLTRCLANC